MADPRFYQMAVPLGHVYFNRESKHNRTSDDASMHSSPEAMRAQHFKEFKSTMVGPVDPRKFLDTFLNEWAPILGKFGEGDVIRTYDAVPPTTTYKQFIIDPLVKILNKRSALGLRHSGDIVFCDRAKLPKSKRSHMPDIIAVREHFQFVVDESKSSDKPLEIDDMGLAEYFITVQPDRDDDFFNDPTPGMDQFFDPKKPTLDTHFMLLDHIFDLEQREKVKSRLEEMIERIVDIWSQQWRSHIFTISIAGSMARFLRWDKSGTIITRAFDIRQEPGLLVDFLRLYYHSSKGARGFLTIVSWNVKDESGEDAEETEGRWGGIKGLQMVMNLGSG